MPIRRHNRNHLAAVVCRNHALHHRQPTAEAPLYPGRHVPAAIEPHPRVASAICRRVSWEYGFLPSEEIALAQRTSRSNLLSFRLWVSTPFSDPRAWTVAGGDYLEESILRVLVVDDYEPWRAFVASMLRKHPELRIAGEATNGLEAVQFAQQLQPDLILLDIGLPKLNGLEAVPRIREVCPRSKILFASENRSADIVHKALSSGAVGYVVKSDAGSDLLPAVNAVLAGKRFVSTSLSRYAFTELNDSQPATNPQDGHAEKVTPAQNVSHDHEVGFYSDDRRFLDHVGRFIESALKAGNAAIVVATESHRKDLLSELQRYGPEVRAAIEEGRYFSLDAEETLSTVMVNGVLDPVLFLEQLGDLILTARETTSGEHPRVAVFGECVHLLWVRGNTEAAIKMEKLGNKLTKIHDVDILCGYSLSSVEIRMDHHLFQRVCAEHSAVYSL